MKIAVASKGLDTAPYFESCTNYNCFSVLNGILVDYRNLPMLDQQNLSPVDLLHELGIDVILVGCLRKNTRALLEKHGFIVICGAKGEAKQVVDDYLSDTLIACDGSCDEQQGQEQEEQDTEKPSASLLDGEQPLDQVALRFLY